MADRGKRSIAIGGAVVLILGMLVGAGYLASTLWPKVVVVEQKAVDSPKGPVGAKPGLQAFDDLVARVCPAIVRIVVTPAVKLAASDDASAKTSAKAGAESNAPGDTTSPFATGFLIDADGSIIAATKALGDGASFAVTLNDGRRFAATRVGDDPLTGLALLKIEADGLSFLRFSTNVFPRAGEWVVAISSPAALGCIAEVSTVAADSIVAGDTSADYLELRPDLNPTDIGAPVFNDQGRVIGIAGLGRAPDDNAPARFILPAALAARRIDAIRSGALTPKALGIVADNLTPALATRFAADPDQRGSYVALVVPGSAADQAGARVGDIVVNINGQALARAEDLDAMTFAGNTVTLSVLRRGQAVTLSLTLAPPVVGKDVRTGKSAE